MHLTLLTDIPEAAFGIGLPGYVKLHVLPSPIQAGDKRLFLSVLALSVERPRMDLAAPLTQWLNRCLGHAPKGHIKLNGILLPRSESGIRTILQTLWLERPSISMRRPPTAPVAR